MLITTEVEIKWHPRNKAWYINKGYFYTKLGDIIKVKTNDLLIGSNVDVEVKCDCKECDNPISFIISWQNYMKTIQKYNNKYYCKRCISKLYGGEKGRLTKLKNGKSFKQWCIENLSKEECNKILNRWDCDINVDKNGNILTPDDVSCNSIGINGKGYWFKCLDYPEHGSEQKHICSLTSGKQSFINCSKCNMINITHPHLSVFLVNKDDIFKYSMGSKNMVLAKCLECGHEKETRIVDLVKFGVRCPRCSSGYYPEKFLFSMLEQICEKFQTQLSKITFKWCDKYKYDFYIDKMNGIIIEAMGLQHYEENKLWGSLLKIQKNDQNKEELAKANNIKNYIVLDCRKSEMYWIKNNVMQSDLPKLLNFKEEDIDWVQCDKYARTGITKKICEEWNNGVKNILKIAEIFKINSVTVRRHLNQGFFLEWTNYNGQEEKNKNFKIIHEKNSVKVICITTNEIFKSQSEAGRKYNINKTSISSCCSHKRKSAGKLPNGTKMVWMYYDEYILKSENEIREIISNALKVNIIKNKIICLTINEIYNSIKEAGRKFNIDPSGITRCCKGKQKYAGKHPVTNQEMVWQYCDS